MVPREGESAYPLRYTVHVGVTAIDPGAVQTVILTHAPLIPSLTGVAAEAPEMRAWLAALDKMAEHPTVHGVVITDMTTEMGSAVAEAYKSWQVAETSTERANRVALAPTTAGPTPCVADRS